MRSGDLATWRGGKEKNGGMEVCFDRTLIRLIELVFTDFVDADGMENGGRGGDFATMRGGVGEIRKKRQEGIAGIEG